MQKVVPATEHNPNDHTDTEILSVLRGRQGVRRFSFRYDLVDSANVLIQPLTTVKAGKIEQNWLADIKRRADFTIRDTGEIDYLSNRIQPWVRIAVPPFGAEDWAEWPQGVFLLATPTRGDNAVGVVTRDVKGYDSLLIYVDDAVVDRYSVAAGAQYIATVSTLLGSIPKNITPSTVTLPTAKEWEPGTPKLTIINELLGAVNYESLSFDETGRAIVVPYVSPQDRPSEYIYADDHDGLVVPGVDQELDLFSIPNRWTLVVSDPDRAVLTATYTNTDPSSPTSTIRRQRTIVDFRTEQDAANQAALDAKVARLAFEASQVYEAIDFKTGMFPIHSGNDVYRIEYDPLAINAKYSEHTWSMDLKNGAKMEHRARRVVQV
jgi:hypothetical protein